MQNLDINYILDATAFYAGLPLRLERFYTTSLVFDEVRHIKSDILDLLLETKRLQIIEPDPSYIEDAKSLVKKTGDVVSNADLSIIALALSLPNACVITDDYAIINILKNAGVKVVGKRIRIGKWIKYCTACRISYLNHTICDKCGNKLRRKLIRSMNM